MIDQPLAGTTPVDEETLLLSFMDGAIGKSLRLTREDLDVLLSLANAKLRSGHIEEARSIYGSLILFEPGRIEHQQGLANLCLHEGEYEALAKISQGMVRLAPNNAFGYYFAGVASLALGHLQPAKEDLEEALWLAVKDDNAVLQNDIAFRLKAISNA